MKRSILSVCKSSSKIGLLAALVAGLFAATSVPAATITAVDSTGFTNALNSAVLGDTIVLNAGTTYTGSFNLPNKTTGSGYITIQSSALASLPAAGTRVNASHAANMPKIQMANAFGSAIGTVPGAHHYKLIGLQVVGPTVDTQPDGISNISWPIIRLGDAGTNQDTLAEVPNNIIIDRCLVRANSTTQRLKVGITLNSASTDITNCTVSGIQAVAQDSQAMAGYNGPGPFNIINNFLEGAGENVMFGGADAPIANMIPSDIVVAKNHFFKPLRWKLGDPSYGGVNYTIKNIFELKNAQRVLIEGNLFENNWSGQGQSGYGIVFTPRNQDGGNNWAVVQDVTYRKNILKNSAGYSILGEDYNFPSQRTNHITIENNLNLNITSAFAGNGKLYQFSDQSDWITINHNTSFHDSNVLDLDGSPHANFVFKNNVQAHNDYGVIGGGGVGAGSLNLIPGIVYQKNVLMDNTSNYSLNTLLSMYNPHHGGWNPTSLQFPQNGWTGVLVNQANPGSNYAGYKIDPASAYHNAATDGTDIGCNIDEVVAATTGCVSGVWPGGGTTTVTLKNGVNGYTGNTSFRVDGQTPTTYLGPNSYYLYANAMSGTNGYVGRPFYKFDLSPAASGIPANAVITSATLQLRAEYSTGNPGNGNISLHRMAPVNSAFTVNYSAATRNTYNGVNSWTGGANAAGDVANSNNDYLDTPDGTVTLPPEGTAGNITFNVTSSVQAWVNGTANNGWIVLPAARTVYLGTSADLHGSADFPVLTVTYQSTPPSTTKVLKNGVNGYTGAASFWANGQAPTTYHGPNGYFLNTNSLSGSNGYVARPFYKFDLTQGTNAIPVNATIESATLKVKIEYSTGSADAGIAIYRVKPVNNAFNVNYSAATRNSYNGTASTWTGGNNAGGDVANSNNDFLDTPVATATLPADGNYLTVDVTSSVQAWVNGEANNGWLWIPNARTVYMGSTADLHGSGDYPELTVTYH